MNYGLEAFIRYLHIRESSNRFPRVLSTSSTVPVPWSSWWLIVHFYLLNILSLKRKMSAETFVYRNRPGTSRKVISLSKTQDISHRK